MNILIINAFGTSGTAIEKFEAFCNLIKQTLKRISKHSGIDSFEFIYKNPSNIDEFIYDPDFNPNEGTKTNITNKKNFDKIDMVFIDGYEKYLPWKRIGYKLSLLLRLCKTCNKILYAGGVALEILIYYLATGSHTELNFVNAKGEIQSIEEIHLIPPQFLHEIKKNDHFLDFVTGDVFEYRSITKTWESIVNIGLHKQLIAEKYMSRGKFVLPNHYTDKYYNERTIVSNCKELKISITKPFLSHWLVKGISNEFVSYSTLTWFPHYFNVIYERYQFQTICESNKGPVVIEHGESIGVAFHASIHYKETVSMLENFIKQKFKYLHERFYHLSLDNEVNGLEKNCIETKHKKEKEVPPMFKSYKVNDETKLNELKDKYKKKSLSPMSFMEKINCSRPFSKITKVKKEAAHCGFSFNNRNMIFVEDNSINQRPVSCFGMNVLNKTNKHKRAPTVPNENVTQMNFEKSGKYALLENANVKHNEHARISEIFLDEDNLEHKSMRKSNSIKKRSNTFTQIYDTDLHLKKEEMNKHDQNAEEYITFIDKEKMEEEQMINYYKHLRREISSKLEEINSTEQYKERKKKIMKHKKQLHYHGSRNSYTNIGLTKKPSCKSNIFIHSSKSTKHKEFKNGSQYISMYPYVKKFSSFSEMRIPVSEPSYPFSVEQSMSNIKSNINENKENRNEFLKSSNQLKVTVSNHKLIKIFERDRMGNNKWTNKKMFSPNKTISNNENSKQKYDNPLSAYKFREVTPNKWLSPNGFVV